MTQPSQSYSLKSSDSILEIEHLEVCYGDFIAVNDLNLSLKQGEVFGLLGPNGAGKTTTIRVLIGQRRPDKGHARLAGMDIVRHWDQVKSIFGYVPDRENHFEEFTGRRNLQIFCGLYNVDESRIDECLDMVELSEAGDLQVKGYSLGMRRKLLLARGLLHQPKVLYLDEPTANLDIHSTEVVHRILRDLKDQGVTILITTHNMKEVEEVCDRVAILCKGSLIALDSPLALRQEHAESKVDVIFTSGERRVYDMESLTDREALSQTVASGEATSIKTREFNFHETFLKLTGTAFE